MFNLFWYITGKNRRFYKTPACCVSLILRRLTYPKVRFTAQDIGGFTSGHFLNSLQKRLFQQANGVVLPRTGDTNMIANCLPFPPAEAPVEEASFDLDTPIQGRYTRPGESDGLSDYSLTAQKKLSLHIVAQSERIASRFA